MSALPALTEPYFTRGNVSFGSNNTTATLLVQFYAWALKAALCDQLTGGSTAGTRHADSVWTVVGSSNGSAAGLDAVDRWGSSFNAANIVRNTNGNAHSWIVLRNAANGYDICIDMNSVSNGQFALTAVKTSQGFTGGTTTSRPQAVSNNEEFSYGTQSVNAATPITIFGDHTLSSATWFHFGTNADGSRFWFAKSRTTQGVFDGFSAFWKAEGGRVGDTRNQWWLNGGGSTSGRGCGALSPMTTTNGSTRRGHANGTPPAGGIRPFTYANTTMANVGVDHITGDYLAVPCEVGVAASGIPLACGVLPDLHFTSGGTVASSIPSAGAQERTIFGDTIAPCGVALTT